MKDALILAARNARRHAYAPYSGYLVGAAALSESGEIYAGANVENISYGLTLCAERVAISSMVSSGQTQLKAIAVFTQDGGTPCGMCLQTMLEFAPDPATVEVYCVSDVDSVRLFKLIDLSPYGFSSLSVKRTKPSDI